MRGPDQAVREKLSRVRVLFYDFDGVMTDNRVLVEVNRDGPPGLRAKAYEASRRNYDRLKAEGKVIE